MSRETVRALDHEMERRSVLQYQRALPGALKMLRITERVVEDAGPGGYTVEECRDGKKSKLVVDQEVLSGMQGGIFGIWSELRAVGMQPYADYLLTAHKNNEEAAPVIIEPSEPTPGRELEADSENPVLGHEGRGEPLDYTVFEQ